MPEDLRKKLGDAVAHRDNLAASIQRIQGRLDKARSDKVALEQQCRDKNIEPDKLPETITALETRLAKEIEAIESQNQQAETELQRFEGEN